MKKQSTFLVGALAAFALALPATSLQAQSQKEKAPDRVIASYDIEDPDPDKVPLSEKEYKVEAISLYPNPAQESIHVNIGNLGQGRTTVDIYDLIGTHILHRKLDELNNSISLSQFKPGVYILVSGNQSIKFQKI